MHRGQRPHLLGAMVGMTEQRHVHFARGFVSFTRSTGARTCGTYFVKAHRHRASLENHRGTPGPRGRLERHTAQRKCSRTVTIADTLDSILKRSP